MVSLPILGRGDSRMRGLREVASFCSAYVSGVLNEYYKKTTTSSKDTCNRYYWLSWLNIIVTA